MVPEEIEGVLKYLEKVLPPELVNLIRAWDRDTLLSRLSRGLHALEEMIEEQESCALCNTLLFYRDRMQGSPLDRSTFIARTSKEILDLKSGREFLLDVLERVGSTSPKRKSRRHGIVRLMGREGPPEAG